MGSSGIRPSCRRSCTPLVERGLRNSAKKQECFLKLIPKSRKALIPPVSSRILFPPMESSPS